MGTNFFIKADVFGKTKYWNQIDGLHSGKGKLKGYSIYSSEKDANAEIKKLKKIFHSGIKFTVHNERDIPFIKRQIVAREKGERICTYCGTSNSIKKKHCRKCKKYQG